MRFYSLFICLILSMSIGLLGCGEDKSANSRKASKERKQAPPKVEKTSNLEKSNAQTVSSQMDPGNMKKAKALIASVPKEEVTAVDAKKAYKKFCTSCHGFKGNSKFSGATDLTKSKSALTRRVAQIYFGKGVMTPFKGVMTDAEIIAVAEYVAVLRK